MVFMPSPNWGVSESIQRRWTSIRDRMNTEKFKQKAKNFYSAVNEESYQFSDRNLAFSIKNKDGFDKIIAEDAERIGKALQVEMRCNGGNLKKSMYSKVKQQFFRFSEFAPTGYGDVCDTYSHGGDASICKYLIATWKYGKDLGNILGMNDEQIFSLKKAIRETYSNSISISSQKENE